MSATKRLPRSPALATILALLALALILSSFSRAASAEERPPGTPPPVIGGFASGPLPRDGDVSKVRGVMGVSELSEATRKEEVKKRKAGGETGESTGPRDKRLRLTIPKLGMKDLRLGNSSEQAFLDREGIMHLKGTDFPWQENSNTYIAGHAIGYPGGRVPEAFRNLSGLKKDDKVTLRDSRGETYRYRVYERLIVDPNDFWVTQPVRGKDIVSLQTCYPEPTFEKRLIVRAQRIG
jgi:LPXTG-site transpeptidase (sortase) family protein